MPPVDSSFVLCTLQLIQSTNSLVTPFSLPLHCIMAPELEKPRVTEIQVRMDCNGCVQKIKKALHGINGIYDLYIDVPQQKLTIIGWADPEKIVKAIRKSRKIATICSHTESTEPAAQPPEQPPQTEGVAPAAAAPDTSNPPPAEAPPAEAAPPAEPPKDPPPPENLPPEEKPSPSPIAVETNPSQQPPPPGPKDVGEVHVVYQYPPDYGYRYGYSHGYGAHWNRYSHGQGFPPEPPQPIHVTHSYNTYRPSPYVTGYEYIQSPPPRTHYNRMDRYTEDYHENNRSSNITSIFSDENPNACKIM